MPLLYKTLGLFNHSVFSVIWSFTIEYRENLFTVFRIWWHRKDPVEGSVVLPGGRHTRLKVLIRKNRIFWQFIYKHGKWEKVEVLVYFVIGPDMVKFFLIGKNSRVRGLPNKTIKTVVSDTCVPRGKKFTRYFFPDCSPGSKGVYFCYCVRHWTSRPPNTTVINLTITRYSDQRGEFVIVCVQ